MAYKTFAQFQIGDFAKIEHTITENDITKFVELTGDNNPLHVNKAFAKKTIFKDTVAHGMLGASFVSTLIGKHIPGDGALWISQSFDFLLPVRVNDTLTLHATIIEKHESQNVLVLDIQTTNQNKQTVVKGVSKVKCLQLESEPDCDIPTEDAKVVIITGGSRGIGATTAEYLAKKGYRVVINYSQDRSGAESTLKSIKQNGGDAITYQADMRDENAINTMIDHVINHYGTVSGLVYGATSKLFTTDFLTLEWKDFENHFDIQLRGAFHCIQRLLKEFIKNKNGAVVFIGSIAADATPPLKMTGYTVAKAALQTLSKSLALEFGPLGIRFNVVSPGMTETGLISNIPEKARLLTKMQIPLRRLAKPEDISGAIEFLLSREAHYITGETLRICGGHLML